MSSSRNRQTSGKASPQKEKTPGKASSRRQRQTVRMTSITRKLHFHSARRQLGSIIAVTLGILLLCFLAFVIYQELKTFGSLSWDRHRSFSLEEISWFREDIRIWGVYYCVQDPQQAIRMAAQVLPAGLIVLVPVLALFILRLINILLSWHKESVKIRKILRPINELALRAEELSKLNYSEDKYQILEDAITHIDPEEMQALSFGDSDLAGVETAMNNLLTRIRESYQQQARFVNDASHELRTPIAIIEGYANMLDRWGTEDEKVLTESITAIKNESSHMKHLVEQLLFLARGDSGRTALQLQKTSLSGLMQEIYEESLMIDENHHYRYTPSEQDIVIQADTGLLKQAVRILVDNAAKYTRENDEILLSVGRAGRSSYLQVQDNGIGMAEADVAHMFDRFYRSDEVRKYKGTGLGLSISKWIVDKHGGYFEVTSRQELGTRIRIVLPDRTVRTQERGAGSQERNVRQTKAG